MTIRQFQTHKNEWWVNLRTKLEALRFIYQNSSYKTYSISNKALFEEHIWYLKQLVDLEQFPLPISDLNVYNPDHFADTESVNQVLIPFINSAIQKVQNEINRLNKNITWVERSLGEKIHFLRFMEYNTNWENNFQYCKFEIVGKSPIVFEELLSNSFNHEVVDGKRVLTVFIEEDNWQ